MSELATMFRSPVLHAAIEIVKTESLTHLPDPVPGVDYQAQVAAAGAYTVGWTRAIRALESLTLKPLSAGVRMSIEKQFDDAARRRMREAGIYTESEIQSIKP
jgi:hypothetical protein